MPVIYLVRLSPDGFSGLPSDMGRATLMDAGLHDLTTPKTHGPCVATRPVGSYPAFSPLPPEGDDTSGGGYFLLRYSTLADSFLLGSGMLCVARTFLLHKLRKRQAGRLLRGCKGTKTCRCGKVLSEKVWVQPCLLSYSSFISLSFSSVSSPFHLRFKSVFSSFRNKGVCSFVDKVDYL